MTLMTILRTVITIITLFILVSLFPAISKKVKEWYEHHFDPRAPVAIVTLQGNLTSSYPYVSQLHTYFSNAAIKAILLNIDSCGGSDAAGQALFHEIMLLKKKYPKPIITLVENRCTSAAYYIACSTDYIICSGASLIGSIGTAFSQMFQLKDFIEQYKIEYVSVVAGKYKNSTDPFVDLNAEEKEMLQAVVDDAYAQFTQDVARRRNLSIGNSEQWAQGKLFTGRQAIKLGLVDELGSFSNVVTMIKRKALIEEEIRWICQEPKTNFYNWIMNDNSFLYNLFDPLINMVVSRFQQKMLL